MNEQRAERSDGARWSNDHATAVAWEADEKIHLEYRPAVNVAESFKADFSDAEAEAVLAVLREAVEWRRRKRDRGQPQQA